MQKGKFLLIFISIVFLPLICNAFYWKPEVKYPSIGSHEITDETDFPQYIIYVFNFGIIAGVIIAVLSLIYGGFLYITSADNSSRLNEAKSQITSAFLGLLILLTSHLILTILNPKLTIVDLPEIPKEISEGYILRENNSNEKKLYTSIPNVQAVFGKDYKPNYVEIAQGSQGVIKLEIYDKENYQGNKRIIGERDYKLSTGDYIIKSVKIIPVGNGVYLYPPPGRKMSQPGQIYLFPSPSIEGDRFRPSEYLIPPWSDVNTYPSQEVGWDGTQFSTSSLKVEVKLIDTQNEATTVTSSISDLEKKYPGKKFVGVVVPLNASSCGNYLKDYIGATIFSKKNYQGNYFEICTTTDPHDCSTSLERLPIYVEGRSVSWNDDNSPWKNGIQSIKINIKNKTGNVHCCNPLHYLLWPEKQRDSIAIGSKSYKIIQQGVDRTQLDYYGEIKADISTGGRISYVATSTGCIKISEIPGGVLNNTEFYVFTPQTQFISQFYFSRTDIPDMSKDKTSLSLNDKVAMVLLKNVGHNTSYGVILSENPKFQGKFKIFLEDRRHSSKAPKNWGNVPFDDESTPIIESWAPVRSNLDPEEKKKWGDVQKVSSATIFEVDPDPKCTISFYTAPDYQSDDKHPMCIIRIDKDAGKYPVYSLSNLKLLSSGTNQLGDCSSTKMNDRDIWSIKIEGRCILALGTEKLEDAQNDDDNSFPGNRSLVTRDSIPNLYQFDIGHCGPAILWDFFGALKKSCFNTDKVISIIPYK